MDIPAMVNDIEQGRQRQRHRDPLGDWLTGGQCAERLMEVYDVSRRTVFNRIERMSRTLGFRTRIGTRDAPGTIAAESFTVLEADIAQDFSRREEPRLTFKECCGFLKKTHRVSPAAVRAAMAGMSGTQKGPLSITEAQYALLEAKFNAGFPER
jgi:hypothetical protein